MDRNWFLRVVWMFVITWVALILLHTFVNKAEGAPLDAWSERPVMRVCLERGRAGDAALADWISYLWAPGVREFYITCFSPDLTIVHTTLEETLARCGGNTHGCYYFGTDTAYGTSRDILAHEIGHGFGLVHPPGEHCVESIMTFVNCSGFHITAEDAATVIANARP